MKLDKTMYDKLREEGVKLSEISFEAEESGQFIQIQVWQKGIEQIMVRLGSGRVIDVRIVEFDICGQ